MRSVHVWMTRAALITLLVATMAVPASADSVGWRMDGDGRFPDAEPPVTWSKNEGFVWKADMPSWSNASPVLLADRNLIFVMSEPDEIIAVDAERGEIAWTDSMRSVTRDEPNAHDANGRTTATPVSDGKQVFSVYGTGVVAAHTVGGERQWARVIEEPGHRWGTSASPLLVDDRLIVHIVDLVALDPASGKEIWRVESEASWGSPVTTRIGEVAVVITPAGDVFRVDDGKEIAREIGKLTYATPVVDDGIIYFIEKRATAVRIPSAIDQPFETLWTSRLKGSRHYASSLIHDGLIYAVSREEFFAILDAATGALLDERRLDLFEETNSAYPSLALAGDKIFLSTENGVTAILRPGRTYDEIGRNDIETFRSTPIFAGDRMYIRTVDHLYAFGTR
ncbi:MAG: PQQ-binding-like beta-propeller repeat protein [Acidobacteriota bacterium]